MRTTSYRCDIVVLGGGIAGMCAAVSAAREGANVALIDDKKVLGGRISGDVRYPLEQVCNPNYIYRRESGLLDDLLCFLLLENVEGTYSGQARAFKKWVLSEKRIKLFLNARAFDCEMNESGDKVSSLLAISGFEDRTHSIFGKYFIDCSGVGALSRFSLAPSETGFDLKDYSSASDANSDRDLFYGLVGFRIREAEKPIPFSCPKWVGLKWEDNHLSAKLSWMKSLSASLTGYHQVEWCSTDGRIVEDDVEVIAWAAWDYLKNRSPMRDAASNLYIEEIGGGMIRPEVNRGVGDYLLTPDDLFGGSKYTDSVVLGRALLDEAGALMTSDDEKVCLANPFEIPLRALYSKKIKNLLWAGEHISASSRISRTLSHSPVCGQMGVAAGVCAWKCIEKKRLPRTLAKAGYVDELRKTLIRANHLVGRDLPEDEDNLTIGSSVIASSTLDKCISPESLEGIEFIRANACLLRFPFAGDRIDKVSLLASIPKDCEMEIRCFQGSSDSVNVPGDCLSSSFLQFQKTDGSTWTDIEINMAVSSHGWHFLEILSDQEFMLPLQADSPVGFGIYLKRSKHDPRINNAYLDYIPLIGDTPGPSPSPFLQIPQSGSIYSAMNVVLENFRPTNLPNLWISQPTDFKYPEFLEISWGKEREFSRIDLSFDPSFDFTFPGRPRKFDSRSIPSLVRDYNIYYVDAKGHSHLLHQEENNSLGFRIHEFPSIIATGIELEILSTNGLNRAQVYQVRAYS